MSALKAKRDQPSNSLFLLHIKFVSDQTPLLYISKKIKSIIIYTRLSKNCLAPRKINQAAVFTEVSGYRKYTQSLVFCSAHKTYELSHPPADWT